MLTVFGSTLATAASPIYMGKKGTTPAVAPKSVPSLPASAATASPAGNRIPPPIPAAPPVAAHPSLPTPGAIANSAAPAIFPAPAGSPAGPASTTSPSVETIELPTTVKWKGTFNGKYVYEASNGMLLFESAKKKKIVRTPSLQTNDLTNVPAAGGLPGAQPPGSSTTQPITVHPSTSLPSAVGGKAPPSNP